MKSQGLFQSMSNVSAAKYPKGEQSGMSDINKRFLDTLKHDTASVCGAENLMDLMDILGLDGPEDLLLLEERAFRAFEEQKVNPENAPSLDESSDSTDCVHLTLVGKKKRSLGAVKRSFMTVEIPKYAFTLCKSSFDMANRLRFMLKQWYDATLEKTWTMVKAHIRRLEKQDCWTSSSKVSVSEPR